MGFRFIQRRFLLVVLPLMLVPAVQAHQVLNSDSSTIFFEDFEAGSADWFADNDVWEVDSLDSAFGPDQCWSGKFCAGTVVRGNYPPSANSRLVSPDILIPQSNDGNVIHLRFWHWFDIAGSDWGSLQFSVNGGIWTNLPDVEGDSDVFRHRSGAWTQYISADLSAYAGDSIRIGFKFTSDSALNVSSGWYVDDFMLEKTGVSLSFPESFEGGWGNWFADNGVWQIGPLDGSITPTNCWSGSFCAGTILNGNYTPSSKTILVSPPIKLPSSPSDTLKIRFWHWYDIASGDWGGETCKCCG